MSEIDSSGYCWVCGQYIGDSVHICPGRCPVRQPRTGWICPRCGTVYSPFVTQCPKCNSNITTIPRWSWR